MPGDWHLPAQLFLTHKEMIQEQDTRLSLMSFTLSRICLILQKSLRVSAQYLRLLNHGQG